MHEYIASDKLRFSLVIPTYESPVNLDKCLRAVLAQSTKSHSLEIIVVNDGSKDGLEGYDEITKRYPELVYLFFKHSGPAAARNAGIKYAKGDIILFLDDDSLVTDGWLNANIKAWQEFPDSAGIGGFVKSTKKDNIYCRTNCYLFNWYLKQSASDNTSIFLNTCNAGYKKPFLDRIGGFDESFKNPSGEDRDINIRIHRISGNLRLDDRINVYHNRDINLIGFLKKHFDYGKAAFLLYSKYTKLQKLPKRAYIELFLTITIKFKRIFEAYAVLLLIILSQIATLFGYISASLLKRKKVKKCLPSL